MCRSVKPQTGHQWIGFVTDASNEDTPVSFPVLMSEPTEEMAAEPVSAPAEHLFYRPDRELYSQRGKIVDKRLFDPVLETWTLSESFKSHGMALGSILENRFPWQTKWHQRFEPPKTAEELEISKHWRYDGPKLEQLVAETALRQSEVPLLEKSTIPALKSMAVKILSGTTQESLAMHAFQKMPGTKESVASEQDGNGSVISAQLKMPESQTGTKRSILEGFTKTSKTKKSATNKR